MGNNHTTEQAELVRAVDLGQALHRLENNPDFIAVVKDAYIMQNLVVKSQDMMDIQPPIRQEALECIQSVNYLRKHFSDVRDNALGAIEVMNGGSDE